MSRLKSMATQEEILAAFHTDEPFKAFATRIGMSPNTLRGIWKASFGEDASVARGKALQAQAAAKTCRETASTRVYSDVRVPCSTCGLEVILKANQVAQLDVAAFICDDCKYDRACPVCSQLVDGALGLAHHFRHRREAGDKAHLAVQETQEAARWSGLIEGPDFVSCLVCGHRAESLARHIKALHGITAVEYRLQYGDARIRSENVAQARRLAIQTGRTSPAYEGNKGVTCPTCGVAWEASKFLVPETHDLRCEVCRARENVAAEVARWVGKTEPEDFVSCRVCQWKGENITGHLMASHLDLGLSGYRQQYPEAPLFAEGVMCFPTHKLNLTLQDLAPFKDGKGRVQVALAADVLGCAGLTVRNYCKALSLPTRNRLAFQKRVLDSLAEILGVLYEWEWSDARITNPLTDYRFFFDGYFPKQHLLVEVHGKQHFVYVPYWHQTRSVFEALQARDEEKQRQALAVGYRLLTVRYDEPYTDVAYLRRRLLEMGVLSVT